MRLSNRSAEMEVFVRAVDAGSLAAAGRQLGMSPSAVSKQISRLEERLNVRLLSRNARQMSLTQEGEVFFQKSVRVLEDIDAAERAISDSAEPKGVLRVNSSLVLGNHLLAPLLPRFYNLYPQIELDLHFSDEVSNLIDERSDVALRLGKLKDADLRMRQLGQARILTVAAPEYLQRHGTPNSAEDLHKHRCLGFTFPRNTDPWGFADASSGRLVHMVTRANNGETLRQLALAGVGLARLADFHIADDLAQGRLIPVLKSLSGDDREPVSALFVDRRHFGRRLRVFLDFLVDVLSPALRRAPQR